MPVATILTAIAAIVAAGVSAGTAVSAAQEEDKQNSALGRAKQEDLAMYQLETRAGRKMARENLALNKRQVSLNERAQTFNEKTTLDDRRKTQIEQAVGIINNAAVRDVDFKRYLNGMMSTSARRA